MRKIKNRIRNFLWKTLKIHPHLKSGIGLNIVSDNDFFVFGEVFLNKEYDEAIKIFLQEKLEQPIILDLGANVGYFTLRVADELLLKKINDFSIHSIEASLQNFTLLGKRLSQPLLQNKVFAYHGLVGLKAGFSYLATDTDHYGYAVNNNESGSGKIDYLNIEKLIDAPAKNIDLIKCDIEGSEEVFLSQYSSLLQRTNLAVIEFHHTTINYDKCVEYLSASGLEYLMTLNENIIYKTSVKIFKRMNVIA